MICPRCNAEMRIEAWEVWGWGGWIWQYHICGYCGRIATQNELDQQDIEPVEYFDGVLQNNYD